MTDIDPGPPGHAAPTPSTTSIPTLDPDRYRHHLDDPEASREQQDAVLAALWQIAATFAAAGFQLDAVQLLQALEKKARTEEQSSLEPEEGSAASFRRASLPLSEQEVSHD